MPVAGNIMESMVAFRRDMHAYPELSWKEHRTAEKIRAFLDRLGISHRAAAETGVIAEIPGRLKKPLVALRADTDALLIQEETGLPFASQHAGVMHACGHDGHTSMLLGAAALLSQDAQLPVSVRLIFQPAEETGAGALAMMEAGALDDVAMIFGGHLDRHYPTGSIVITDGAVNASSDKFHIEIAGSGGHAARPHEAVDAVVVGSLLVMAIQTIVSREVNPAHPSVVTVGKFDAGTAANVIASHARLSGSIRAQDPSVRSHLQQSIQRISASVGQLHDARISVTIDEGTPPVINPREMTAVARMAAKEVVGEENIRTLEVANMGGEDFAHYLTQVTGCYVRIGAQIEGKEGFPAHSSRFDFDEDALPVGAAYYHALAKVAGEQIARGI